MHTIDNTCDSDTSPSRWLVDVLELILWVLCPPVAVTEIFWRNPNERILDVPWRVKGVITLVGVVAWIVSAVIAGYFLYYGWPSGSRFWVSLSAALFFWLVSCVSAAAAIALDIFSKVATCLPKEIELHPVNTASK